MSDVSKLGTNRLWRGVSAFCAVAAAAGLAAQPASAADQSLEQAMENALVGSGGSNCAALGGPNSSTQGPQLFALCNSIPITSAVNSPQGAAPSDASGTGDDQAKKKLATLRDKKAGLPVMTQYADATGEGGMFDIGQLSGFFNFDYQNVSKHTTYFTPGYNSDRYGGTFGVDHSWDNLVLGVAFDYAHTNANFNNGGGNFNVDSYGGTLYGSVTPAENWFFDGALGYAHKDLEINRNVAFSGNNGNAFTAAGTARGTPSANEYRASINGGYDFNYQNFTYGPRFGWAYARNRLDAYSEAGSTGLELAYQQQTYETLTSSIGAKGSMAISTSFGVLVPQISADYIHEFKNNQQTFKAHFVQDLTATPLVYSIDAPDRDYFGLGIGAVLGLPHGFSGFLNYRALVGDTLKTTQTVTAGVRLEF